MTKILPYALVFAFPVHRLKFVPHVRFGETGTRMLTSI